MEATAVSHGGDKSHARLQQAEEVGLSCTSCSEGFLYRSHILDKVSSLWHRRNPLPFLQPAVSEQENRAESYQQMLDQLKCILTFFTENIKTRKKQSTKKMRYYQDQNSLTSVKIDSSTLPIKTGFLFYRVVGVSQSSPCGIFPSLAMFSPKQSTAVLTEAGWDVMALGCPWISLKAFTEVPNHLSKGHR